MTLPGSRLQDAVLRNAEAPGADYLARAHKAADVAAAHADAVDQGARFPEEAIGALRDTGLMSLQVPRRFGGEGASVGDVVDVCYRLGRACSSSAMIYAMHQVKIACVVHHNGGNAWQEDFLRRVASGQLLLASSTTEGGGGGNVRSSEAAVEHTDGRIALLRNASVISYGAQADAVVTTARRAADADSADQILIVFEKKDYTLERSGGWDTLGMRGTCSAGFTLRAEGLAEQILNDPYGAIHSQTMVPAAHLMWSGVWAGIAAGAVERARKFTRKAARSGTLPPGAAHFTKAMASLRALRALIGASLARYEAVARNPAALGAVDFQTAINLLKVDASELAVTTVLHALRATGLSGYRNDGDVSIGRSLRDILSSPIMINNDRILANLSHSALLSDVPHFLRDQP
jgi:acyl-CoA dehydrogenase